MNKNTYNRKNTVVLEICRWSMIIGTLASGVYAIGMKNWLFAALAVFQSVLLYAPEAVERLFHIRMTVTLKILLMAWIFGSIALGTIFDLYYKIRWWDLLMHGACGVLLAGVGMALPEMLDQKGKAEPSLLYRIVSAFCFSLALGFLWELCEFAVFRLFQRDMQRDVVLNTFATSYFTNQDAVSDVFTGVTKMILETDQGIITVPGYLDIGFFDTLEDYLVHLAGSVFFLLLTVIGRGKLTRLFIPLRCDMPGQNGRNRAPHPSV